MKQCMVILTLLVPTYSFSKSDNLQDCPNFKESYMTCEKISGQLPAFFSSVKIQKKSEILTFTTQTFQGPFRTTYTPDRVVRQGRDHHYLEDGTVLPDLLSHESSYCANNVLYISEITFLPNGSVTQESAEMSIDDKGKLIFKVSVDGKLLLKAFCTK